LGLYLSIDANGRTIWIADAHRDYGKRFVVRADEKLTSFLELNRRFVVAAILLDKQARFSPSSALLNGSRISGGHFPRRFFAPSRPATD
jgi:hypothetical protein